MMFIITFILFLFAPTFFSKIDSNYQWEISLYCYRMLIPVTGFYLFKYIPQSKVKFKSIIACLFVFVFMEAQVGALYHLGYDIYSQFYLLFFYIFLVLFIGINLKKYNFKSDKVNTKNICLCFHKPVTLAMFLSSFLGFPFGGICVYAKYKLYGYKLNKKTFQREIRTPEAIAKKFIVIDTGIKCNQEIINKLNKTVGARAGSRLNCVRTIKPALDMLGKRYSPRWWEMIPPTYSIKVMT